MENNKLKETIEEKTMFDEMKESGSNLPDMVEFLQQSGWKTKNHHDNWINKNYIGEHSTHEAFKLEKEWQETPLQRAIQVLCNAIREDKSEGSLYHAYQCNIAMSFKDEFFRECGYGDVSRELLHKIANEAAKNFLNLLISK